MLFKNMSLVFVFKCVFSFFQKYKIIFKNNTIKYTLTFLRRYHYDQAQSILKL